MSKAKQSALFVAALNRVAQQESNGVFTMQVTTRVPLRYHGIANCSCTPATLRNRTRNASQSRGACPLRRFRGQPE